MPTDIRYLLFTTGEVEAGGGWNDFRAAYVDCADLEVIKKRAQELMCENRDCYAHIADLRTREIIWHGVRE